MTVPPSTQAGDELDGDVGEHASSLARLAWTVATIGFAVAGLILLGESYYGYASVTFAVAVAAGINLL
jgi:hypothetical protein